MSGAAQKITSEENTEQEQNQKDQPLTYDDKLANLYRDMSGENANFMELTIALAAKGVHHHLEVLHAYKLLNSPDAKKLFDDPRYRQKFERALEIVEKREKKALEKGTSKCKDAIQNSKNALTM